MIYLDHAATTPLAAPVLEAVLPWLRDGFGNPSSIHAPGRAARAAVDHARDQLASVLHCDYSELTFTSGGTEADNLAILGALWAAPPARRKLIVSSAEHHAVLHAAQLARRMGFEVQYLPVDREGFADPSLLEEMVDTHTALVSVMHANNETGTIQDIAKMARAAHRSGALFHTDAVQTLGALPIQVRGLDADLLSVSAHKIYGPKGVGALYVKTGTPLQPMIVGGAQERERRGGTENVAGIVGFGAAAMLAESMREEEAERLSTLRDRFIAQVLQKVRGAFLNGPKRQRLPNNANFHFKGTDGASLLMRLDLAGICASSGSACSSGSIEPSHVLSAMGLSEDDARSSVRFTLGRGTTADHLDKTVETLCSICGCA
jgi:cysteine desulfurase